MREILAASIAQIYGIATLPEECKDLANAMTTEQVFSNTGLEAPGRTRERPLPTGEARVVLERGHY